MAEFSRTKIDATMEEEEEGPYTSTLEEDEAAILDPLIGLVINASEPQAEPGPPDGPVRPIPEAEQVPATYTANSEKEKLVLAFVRNFERQFRHLYSQRTRLPLIMNNEYGVEKFVCTTVRPTSLAFKDLYNHQGASSFVADFVTYAFLDNPLKPPEVLPSPTATMWRQCGNCYDQSVLLCSLLEGVGYDAYVVSGYAARSVTLKEGTPVPEGAGAEGAAETVAQPKEKQVDAPKNKYAIAGPRKLESAYEKRMREREEAKRKEAETKAAAAEAAATVESRQPEFDDLNGLRCHAWVLVVAGKREVPETFFIEASTGVAVSPLNTSYHGIEAVWNSKNFWANMQKCTNGLADMQYDLGDTSCWEYIFPEIDQGRVSVETGGKPPKPPAKGTLDLPPSWVQPLTLEPRDYETRCPDGRRTLIEGRSRVEIYAPYLREDGLVRLETQHAEPEMESVVAEVYTYMHRSDKMVKRVVRPPSDDDGGSTEYVFLPGHPWHLRRLLDVQPSYSRLRAGSTTTMEFYSSSRVDGLVKRTSSATSVSETYTGRPDFLLYREVNFVTEDGPKPGRRGSMFGRRASVGAASSMSPGTAVDYIVERYARNEAKPADEDPEVITYYDDVVQVGYHRGKGNISSATRDFFKPQLDEKQRKPPVTKDMVESFDVNPLQKEARNFELQAMLEGFLKTEERCKAGVDDSKTESTAIMSFIRQCASKVELSISFYDTSRNEHIKERRARMEQEAREGKAKQERMEQDYLSPFLVQLDDPDNLTEKDAVWLVDQCKKDLRERLVEKAELIKKWFEKEQAELQQRQTWFQQNQGSLTSEEEEEYVNFCSEALFRIKILEKRLDLLKQTAPQQLVKLDHTLCNDERLAHLLP